MMQLDLLKPLRKWNPDNEQAWQNKGRYYYSLERYDACIESFNKALSLKPDESTSWWGKGLGLQKKGRIEEALECFNKAIEKTILYILLFIKS